MNWKRILNLTYWISGVVIVIFLLSFAGREQAAQVCEALVIDIDQTPGGYLITPDEIEALVRSEYPEIDGMRLTEINIYLLEELIQENSWVADAEVFYKLNGHVFIRVWQKMPIARVFDHQGSFYLDEMGVKMPLSKNFSADVPLITGIRSPQHLEEALVVLNGIGKFKTLSQLTGGISRKDNGDYVIFPAMGHHKVLLGAAQNPEKRLRKLEIFYEKGLDAEIEPAVAWVNLKYRNQVIIQKRGYEYE
jgi:cell division protein FtsQ